MEGSLVNPMPFGRVVETWRGLGQMAEQQSGEEGVGHLDEHDMTVMLSVVEEWLTMHIEHLSKETGIPFYFLVPMFNRMSANCAVTGGAASMEGRVPADQQGEFMHGLLHTHVCANYLCFGRESGVWCHDLEVGLDLEEAADKARAERVRDQTGEPPDLSDRN